MYGIPVFEVGQRVKVHAKPIEWTCPSCNFAFKDYTLYGVIVGPVSVGIQCLKCGNKTNLTEGWYGVRADSDGEIYAYPYTFLELEI